MRKPPPAPPIDHLAALLRELRQRTGLTLTQLGTETTFSRSSWERYLNGRGLPPRRAVEELCRLADEPAEHCSAVWEIARTEWSTRRGPTASAPATADPAKPTPPRNAPPAPSAASTPAPPTPAPPTVPAHAPPNRPVPSVRSAVTRIARVRRLRGSVTAIAVMSVCGAAVAAAALTLLLVWSQQAGTVHAPRSPSVPAAAGPLCAGAACQGQDPLTTRCAVSPQTLAEHRTATGAWVQLRYDEVCGAGWARMWGARIGDRIELRTVGGGRPVPGARVANREDADTYVYTLMSAAPLGTTLQACFVPAAGGERECFRARTRQVTPSTTKPPTSP